MNTTVKNLFTSVCEVYNLRTRDNVTLRQENPTQKDYYSNDFVMLDYVPDYGGYIIMVVNAETSQRDFDGYTRRSAKEMIAYLRGLLAAKNEYIFKGITHTN